MHLEYCGTCRETMELAEALSGLLLESLPLSELAPETSRRLQSRLDREMQLPPPVVTDRAPVSAGVEVGPAKLAHAARTARLRWLAPGIRHAVVQRSTEGGTLRVLRVRSGTALPHHMHRGTELTFLLDGAFQDERGHYGPGDLIEVNEDESHTPVAEGLTDCICLIATQGRLRFTGPIAAAFGALLRV